MKKSIGWLLVVLMALVAVPVVGQEAPPDDVEGACQNAKNWCIQNYWTCRIGSGTCNIACSFLDPMETICAEQYGACMESEMPWYCGFWAN